MVILLKRTGTCHFPDFRKDIIRNELVLSDFSVNSLITSYIYYNTLYILTNIPTGKLAWFRPELFC